jgi:hypothetical protein
MSYAVGFPERWKEFHERHEKFITACYPTLIETAKKVLNRHVRVKIRADDVMFLLGRTAQEDYFELWVLAGNGYGMGASKILRGLYEKVVTAGYLVNNRSEIQQFVDYSIVQNRRILNRVKEIPELKATVDAETFRQAEEDYLKIKDAFDQTRCEKCGSVRQYSWTKLDMTSLAKKAGYDLEKFSVHGFTLPTMKIHTSFADLQERKQANTDGTFQFNAEAQVQHADSALVTATHLLLIALLIQDKYFQLGLEDEIVQRQVEFAQSYGGLSTTQ